MTTCNQPPPCTAPEMSARERTVLRLMADGLSDAEIAVRLVVSISTIEFYVSRLLVTLGVVRRSDAVTLARRRLSAGARRAGTGGDR